MPDASDFVLESPATSPAPEPYDRDATPQPTGSQSQSQSSFFAIKGIIGERPKHYRVEWEGVNPDTDKPWPSEWIPKQDVTAAAIKEWEQKQKNKADKARRKKKAQLKKKRSKENEEDQEPEGEHSPTASSKKRSRLPSDDDDFESDRSYTPPKRAKYETLQDDDEANDADSEYVPSQNLVFSNPTTRASSRSSTPTRPPPRPKSAFAGVVLSPLSTQIREQYVDYASSSPSYRTPSPPSSPETPRRRFVRPIPRTPAIIPDSQPSQGRDIALARKVAQTNPEIELESPRPSKKHKIPFLAAAATDTPGSPGPNVDLTERLEKFGNLLGPKIPSPKIDDSIPESEIRLTVNSQFLELVNEWNEARRYRSVSYDSEYEGYYESLSNTLESIHISDNKTPRASQQPDSSPPRVPNTSQVTHIDDTQKQRSRSGSLHSSLRGSVPRSNHASDDEEDNRAISPASSDSSDISDITVSELNIRQSLNESIRATPTNFSSSNEFRILNPLPSSGNYVSPFAKAASLPRINNSLSFSGTLPREAQSEFLPDTTQSQPVRIYPARQRSTSVVIKEEPEDDDPALLYSYPEGHIKQEEFSDEEEFVEAPEEPTQSDQEHQGQEPSSDDTETFQDAQQPEVFSLGDEVFNIPLPDSPFLETPSSTTTPNNKEEPAKDDKKEDKQEKSPSREPEKAQPRRRSIEKKRPSPETSNKRRQSFPSRPTGEHLTRIADLPIARGKERKGSRFAEELGTLPVNSRIDSWFGNTTNNTNTSTNMASVQQRKVLVLPSEAQLAEMAKARDAAIQETREKLQQEVEKDIKRGEEDFNSLLKLFSPDETSISLPATPVQGIKRDPRNSVPPSQEVIRKPVIIVDDRNPTIKELPDQQPDVIYLGLHMTSTQTEGYRRYMLQQMPTLAHFLATDANEAYFETQLMNIKERAQKYLNDPAFHMDAGKFDVGTLSEKKCGFNSIHGNGKFYFFNELLPLIKNSNIHIVIASGYEKVRLILEAFLRDRDISCSPLGRHSVFPAEPVINSPLKISIVPTAEDPKIQIAPAHLIIAMDDTFDIDVKHIAQAREHKLYDQFRAPILKLVTFNSFEHLTPFYGEQRSADLTNNFREYWQIASTTFLTQGQQPTYEPTAKELAPMVANWLQSLQNPTSGRFQPKPAALPVLPSLMLRRLRIENARPESIVLDVFREHRLQAQAQAQAQASTIPIPPTPEPMQSQPTGPAQPMDPTAHIRSPLLSPNPHARTLNQRPDAEIWAILEQGGLALQQDAAEGRKRRRNNDDDGQETGVSATKKQRQAGMAPVNTGGEEEVYDENFDYSQLSKEELIYCLRVEYQRRMELKGAVEQMQATYEDQKRAVREAREATEKVQGKLNQMNEAFEAKRYAYDNCRAEVRKANKEVQTLKDVIQNQHDPESPARQWFKLHSDNESLHRELEKIQKLYIGEIQEKQTFKNYYQEAQARATELAEEVKKITAEKIHLERRVGAQDESLKGKLEIERRRVEELRKDLDISRKAANAISLKCKQLEDRISTVAVGRPRRG
ncbi:hypothetical protein BJ508DRAFT_49494 [Ascobolus immersus RN42]|uniref:Chromo domain-containing protein n=1 Tax=Ascobolus immersus RN42 TaxID=1160509 RepID=A0A3N4HV16_ASCIM|nr:hypothetical protein BJ508DRAFT_49494 [Ascobolus immersus RN42]